VWGRFRPQLHVANDRARKGEITALGRANRRKTWRGHSFRVQLAQVVRIALRNTLLLFAMFRRTIALELDLPLMKRGAT
jgi:hypothetical protein